MALVLPVPFRIKAHKIPESKKEFYKQYMQSSDWKKKRLERIKYDRGFCQGFHLIPCKKNLQVHHISYKRLGDENIKRDLVTLCKRHHQKVHKK